MMHNNMALNLISNLCVFSSHKSKSKVEIFEEPDVHLLFIS